MAYTKYSLTPANNNAAPPDGAPEGMLPSAVNDTMRDMMSQIRDVGDGIRGGTYTMTSPVITGGSVSGITDLAIADGGTGASTAADARTNLGLGTAATAAATDYATAAQGTKADSALQPAAIGTTVQAYSPVLSSYATNGVSFKNRIINGDMRIDQRNAGASVTGNDGVYVVDRFSSGASQTSKFTMQRITDAPAGFSNSLKVTSSSAYTVGASELFEVRQWIEGFNVADLAYGTAAAKTTTLSFWVKSSLTGTFGGVYSNENVNRSYPFTYTISSANTWEQKSITVAGDTSGTWATTNGTGLRIRFSLGAGSTYQGTAGSWAGAYYTSATSAVNVVSTNAATWQITGVQLEVGSSATPFDTRAYGTELALCQRYTQVFGGDSNYDSVGSTGIAANGNSIDYYSVPLAVQLRAKPSVSVSGAWRVDDGYTAGFTVSNITVQANSVNKTTANLFITSSGLTAGRAYQLQANNSTASRLILNSEL